MKSVQRFSFRPVAAVAALAVVGLVGGVVGTSGTGQVSFGLVSVAQAAEKGGAGATGHGKHGSASTGAAAAGTGSTGKSGKPGTTGGGQVSGSKLGRLNMARAFVSPGFDIANVDDPAAPVAQIALYKDLISGDYSDDALDAAATALGNAATVNPVTLDTVTKLNSILKVTTSWSTSQLDALATKATEVLVARRTEEGETTETK
ncbi:MAG: hypothetical protein GC151_15150 [Betaproteobacteria bacterium]|nr:hypothetical protein [Betaproteobacteria bacterium]